MFNSFLQVVEFSITIMITIKIKINLPTTPSLHFSPSPHS